MRVTTRRARFYEIRAVTIDAAAERGCRTHIYATHGHGDHWFGTDLLMNRFPDAVPYATEGTIRLMHRQAIDGRAELWDKDFPGLIPDSPVPYQRVPADGFELGSEGQSRLRVHR